MKLTKLKALELSEEMYRWWAEHPKKLKGQWPGWEKYSARAECFACEYYIAMYGWASWGIGEPGVCHKECILKKLWPRGCQQGRQIRWKPTPYDLWCSTHDKKYALIIADFCKSEIKRLKRKKK